MSSITLTLAPLDMEHIARTLADAGYRDQADGYPALARASYRLAAQLWTHLGDVPFADAALANLNQLAGQRRRYRRSRP